MVGQYDPSARRAIHRTASLVVPLLSAIGMRVPCSRLVESETVRCITLTPEAPRVGRPFI